MTGLRRWATTSQRKFWPTETTTAPTKPTTTPTSTTPRPIQTFSSNRSPATLLVQPNRWQSISLSTFVGQSGVTESETPPFLSPEWGNVTPFGLPDSVKTLHFANDGWPYSVWMDQGTPPLVDLNYAQGIADPYTWGHSMVLRWSEHLDPTDGVMIDISPASVGNVDPDLFDLEYEEYDQFYNWEEGGDASQGWDVNPATGQPTSHKSCLAAITAGCSRSFGPTAPTAKRHQATGTRS